MHFIVSLVAVIGFEQDYNVTEGIDGTVEVGIRVLSGELGRSVVVRVFTGSSEFTVNNIARCK